jgi:AcrR family transcriptional regulator
MYEKLVRQMKEEENNTKNRILEKAEALFAEKGYHAVSIREITSAAKSNMAAVNYHFSGKKNLYMEVFRTRWVPRELRMYENFKRALAGLDSPSADLVIQALASAYLEGPLTTEELQEHRQLIIREINNPTEAFEYAADHTLRPLFRYLQQYLKPSSPKHSDEESLTLDILSIFGMLLYFNYSRPMITRVTGKRYSSAFKKRLIDHLVRFSLHGLAANGKD